jgi:hypothetical protein
VIMALKKLKILDKNGKGTTHGQPVEDDRHVLLLLFGRGITASRYDGDVAPTDLARSLGTLVDVDAGDPKSIVLPCVKQ